MEGFNGPGRLSVQEDDGRALVQWRAPRLEVASLNVVYYIFTSYHPFIPYP